MTEKYLFADVDLPFHVWVREGCRWVLRNTADNLQSASDTVATRAADLIPAGKSSAA